MTEFAFLIVAVATIGFSKAGGQKWFPAVMVGVVSPIAYLVLYGITLLPLQLIIGKLGVTQDKLPDVWVERGVSFGIIAVWLVVGFLWMRKSRKQKGLNQSPETRTTSGPVSA